MITTAIGVLAISVLTSILKKYIAPKFGSTGVHVTIFVLGCLYAVAVSLFGIYPGLKAVATQGLEMLTLAVATYEVLLKKLGM